MTTRPGGAEVSSRQTLALILKMLALPTSVSQFRLERYHGSSNSSVAKAG